MMWYILIDPVMAREHPDTLRMQLEAMIAAIQAKK